MIVETSNRGARTRRLLRIFKALSDENRLAIFELIRRRCGAGCLTSEAGADQTVSELAKKFNLALSTVSHHLKELRNAELIVCEKRGKQVYCAVNLEALEDVEAFSERKKGGP